MRKRALLVCVVALAIGTACACGAFSGGDGGSPSNAVDAQQDTTPSDAISSEGGVTALDANTTPAEAAPPFCLNTDARFCDDFDNGPVGVGWYGPPHVTDGSVVALNDATFTSPPYSLVSDTTNGNATSSNTAQLTYNVSATFPATLSCAFNMLDEAATASTGELFVINGVSSDDSTFFVSLGLGTSGSSQIYSEYYDSQSDVTGGNTTPTPLETWDTKQWTRIRVDVIFEPTNGVCRGTANVFATTLGGAKTQILTSYSFPLGTLVPCEPQAVSVTIGLLGLKGSRVGVDDVTCDWRP